MQGGGRNWFGGPALWAVSGNLPEGPLRWGVESTVMCVVWSSERIGLVNMFGDVSLLTVFALEGG